MLTGRVKRKCIAIIGIALAITILNMKIDMINIPPDNEMIDYQFNILTVSTVLAGFSFTALGMLLGVSSEKFVEKLKGTDYMLKNSRKLVMSIVFFTISIIISMLYIIGVDKFIINKIVELPMLDHEGFQIHKMLSSFLFINGISFLLVGFIQFLFELRELYRLISYIYSFKVIKQDEKDKFFNVLNNAKEKWINHNDNE